MSAMNPLTVSKLKINSSKEGEEPSFIYNNVEPQVVNNSKISNSSSEEIDHYDYDFYLTSFSEEYNRNM